MGVTEADALARSQRPPERAPERTEANRRMARAVAKVERVQSTKANRPAPSRSERKSNRELTRRRSEDRHFRRLKARLPAGVRPTFVDDATWDMMRVCFADRTGTAIRIQLRRRWNKVAMGALRNAALCPQGDGSTLYTWADDRARAIAALGLGMYTLSTAAEGCRARKWSRVLIGVPIELWRAALADPWTGRRPHRNTLSGTHEALADWTTGKVGYLRALEGAGFCYGQQLPPADALPCERAGKYTLNRYWIVTAWAHVPVSAEQRAELLELGAVGCAAPYETTGTLLALREAPTPSAGPDPPPAP